MLTKTLKVRASSRCAHDKEDIDARKAAQEAKPKMVQDHWYHSNRTKAVELWSVYLLVPDDS